MPTMQSEYNPVGQKFGRLTVISQEGRCPRTNRLLWLLKCDCGSLVYRVKRSFDRGQKMPSCGCWKKDNARLMASSRRKPDCTGKRFGKLKVLGIGDRKPVKNTYVQLWVLECDCGKVIQIPRSTFDGSGQISCGCFRNSIWAGNNFRSVNITGQIFGDLTAKYLTNNKNCGKPAWLFQCVCGKTREMSVSGIRARQKDGIRINCGDRTAHSDRMLHYPPTPNPYPKEAGELLCKYLHLTELPYQQINAAVEDEMRDLLIRAAWIITYRRQQGEEISQLYEVRFFRKYLRYAAIKVFWRSKLEKNGNFLYDSYGKKREIGNSMTNETLDIYPEFIKQGEKFKVPSIQKRFKFNRR